MHDRIWLSYDLVSLHARESLYRWLAAQGARECGPCLATLVYSYSQNLADELAGELVTRVGLGDGSRVYLIYKDPDDGEVTGRFLLGARTTAYGVSSLQPLEITQLN